MRDFCDHEIYVAIALKRYAVAIIHTGIQYALKEKLIPESSIQSALDAMGAIATIRSSKYEESEICLTLSELRSVECCLEQITNCPMTFTDTLQIELSMRVGFLLCFERTLLEIASMVRQTEELAELAISENRTEISIN